MPEQSIHIHEFDNGLTLLVERMTHVQSAAFTMMTPAGSIYEPDGVNGLAAATCDLMLRGAGELNSRELSGALDFLGVQRNENVGWNFLSCSGSLLASNLTEVFPIYSDILRRPMLPEDHFPAVMSGIQQSLLTVEDEPQRKVFSELRKRCYDSPWGRSPDGTLEELSNISLESIQQYYQDNIRPNGMLIGVAGNVDPTEIQKCVEETFGNWQPLPERELKRVPAPGGTHHIEHDSSQTHIGLAYPAPPYGHADYYAAWAAVSVLSGGSSSRLFTEVREKRGLCYSVYATLNSLLDEGRVFVYAGTTTERAQETLDVMLGELKRLGDGIEPDELQRCLARAKSALIMQQESTASRSGSIARDYFHLKRVNTLDDIEQKLNALNVESVLDYVHRFPAENFCALTIGKQPLTL